MGDGLRPLPPGASGKMVVSVVVSVVGKPSVSNPHVSARSCSIFCCARTDAKVVFFALALRLVDSTNNCASEATATTMMLVAIKTSSSEKPLASAVHLDFAKAIHRDVFRLSLARQRQRHRADLRTRAGRARDLTR